MIIAIDGPAGSGKSTVSKILAKRLGFTYIDTGAIYRAVTLKVIQGGLNFDDEEKICKLIDDTKIELSYINGNFSILLDGVDVTKEIRNPNVTSKIFFISNKASIRKKLVGHQKTCAEGVDAVVEGRDIGTVIFPDAENKFFLNADVGERAKRRFLEVKEQDSLAELEDVYDDIKKRDESDSTRKVAPLKRVEDAIYIDTTNISVEDVVDNILKTLGKF
ncbi:MAG: (d)CMP kinase [Candidatus Anammoxibacter sp.]